LLDRSGRIPVGGITVEVCPDVYTLDSTARCNGTSGQPLPGPAQGAQ
jgi:hypothetical protein